MSRPKGSKNKPKKTDSGDLTDKQQKLYSDMLQSDSINTNVSINDFIETKSQIKIVCKCDKCGANIYSSPYIANFNTLSGKANWWRDNMPVRANLCDKCSKSLSDIIQKWWEE